MPIDSDKTKLLRVHPKSKVHFYLFVSSIQKRNFDHAIDHDIFQKKHHYIPNVIKLRNDGFEGNTKNVLLFFLWKI